VGVRGHGCADWGWRFTGGNQLAAARARAVSDLAVLECMPDPELGVAARVEGSNLVCAR